MSEHHTNSLRAERHDVTWEREGLTGSQGFANAPSALDHIHEIVAAGGRIVSFTRVNTVTTDLHAAIPDLIGGNSADAGRPDPAEFDGNVPPSTDMLLSGALDAYNAVWQTHPGPIDAGTVEAVRSKAMTAALFAVARLQEALANAPAKVTDLRAQGLAFADQVKVLLSTDSDMLTVQQDIYDTGKALTAFRAALEAAQAS